MKIAEHFGVTRQAVYERMRLAGIALDRSRRKRLPDLEVGTKELRRLFETEKRSVAQVAQQLGTTPWKVRNAMREQNVASRARGTRPKKYPQVAGLKIGGSFDVPLPGSDLASLNAVRKEARRLGIRVVLRRLNERTARITRTPLLNDKKVASMYRTGMTKTAIAKVFLSDRNNIAKILRRIGVSKSER